jgi:Nucleotidyltransferase domain.
MDIIERRIKERNMVIDRSRNFAQNLPLNSSAFLVGSYARGDFNLWSDVDIVVISNFVGNPLVRLKTWTSTRVRDNPFNAG